VLIILLWQEDVAMWDKCDGFALYGRWLGAIRLLMLYPRITVLRLLVPNAILIL